MNCNYNVAPAMMGMAAEHDAYGPDVRGYASNDV